MTKQQKEEVVEAYNIYWDAYIAGDITSMASFLHEDVHVFGSTLHEAFTNKPSAVAYYQATAAQISNKVEFKNRKIELQPIDKNIMVIEQSDFYLLIDDEWAFYGHARLSTLFTETKDGWKVIYQHGSFPDGKVEEGEQIAAEKIKEENLQLKEAIKRRTVELENKNRELEIEASLEKIRVQALGMRKPDHLLDICETLYSELCKMGFDELRNAMINIYEENKTYFLNYDYAPGPGKTVTKMPYNLHPLIDKQVRETKNAGDAFNNFSFTGSELKEFRELRKNNGEPDDPKLDECSSLHYYFYSIGKGSIGISTYRLITAEKLILLKQFRNVFNLAYQRYTDIVQAEAQAREAQIETALEKIRSRSLAMHHSDELNEVIIEVLRKLQELGIAMENRSAIICLYKEGVKEFEQWVASPEHTSAIGVQATYFDSEIHNDIWNARTNGTDFYAKSYSTEEKNAMFQYFFEHTDLRFIPEQEKQWLLEREYYELAIAFEKHSAVLIANFTADLLDSGVHQILKRFAKVFEQAYIRFLDLQKSEAQARESQIQLAMERVRARTMAMQRSEELKDVAILLFQQVKELGIEPWASGFNIWQEGNDSYIDCVSTPSGFLEPYLVDLTTHPVFREISDAKKRGEDFHVFDTSGELLAETYALLISFAPKQFEGIMASGIPFPTRQINHYVYGEQVGLMFITPEPCPEAHDIFKRFGKVFEQTYTRFLDLQKAEAQVREAQIELALERVRARTMAMFKSDELSETAAVLFQQLIDMGIVTNRLFICIIKDESGDIEGWGTDEDGMKVSKQFLLNCFRNNSVRKMYDAWKQQKKSITIDMQGKELEDYFHYLNEEMHVPFSIGLTQKRRVQYIAYFSNGFIGMASPDEQPSSTIHLLERFAAVFNLTYTRFLDLQKAEAQTKEAQIEAALERVRSQSMAMHKSGDLLEVISVLSNQLLQLGFKVDSANFNTSYREKDWNLWICNPGAPMYPSQLHIPYFDHPFFNRTLESLANGSDFNTFVFSKEEKDAFLDHLYSNTLAKNTPEERKKYLYSKPGFAWSVVYLKNTCITIANYDAEPYTEEQNVILRRFGNAFEQSYTRFLDLQKVEAQAREAKIESALERVRSASMAMHSSEQLGEVIKTVTDQLLALGFSFESAHFITNLTDKGFNLWLSVPGVEHPSFIYVPYDDNAVLRFLQQGITLKKEFDTLIGSKEEKDKFFNHFFTKSDAGNIPDERKKYVFDKPGVGFTTAFRKHFYFTIVNYEGYLHSSEENSILGRFANVFEQSYTRFLDLKKAESQTREAEIQLALERVRARTMAMQRSEELAETCELLFEEFRKLQIVKADQLGTNDRTTIGIFNEADGTYDFSVTALDGKKLDYTYRLSFDEPTNIAKAYAAWKEGKPLLVIDLHGDELNRWFDYLNTLGLPVDPSLYNKRRINTWAFFSRGNLGITTNEPLPEESLQLLQRFADTFNLTYTRFQDLKDAEARTEIAIKEASLDRVRGEIASMRTAEDLQHITPLVWRELTALGVPFFRCGVFIVDDEKQMIHFYLSAADGKPLAALELPIDGTAITQNATAHWREQKVYISHWSKEEFLQFAQDLLSQGQIQNVNTYQGGRDAPESLTLQFVPFAQGMMYVGSGKDLTSEQIALVQSLADAFSTAYARYEDFNKLEAAKQQVESAFKDLRATQTQLIQSEKMASLGELTAGIAHEIQNPLNFVNNFSEVSTELVDEMNEEIQKGNLEDAQQIAKDLKDNLEKINHHGKRAGDIVKGMLQHSRSSSGVKESTDINALADEYLRLAYHGLRAKDKSFNATLITDFDDSIGMMNMIPQDIGRVILNLITNAFYVVDEKKKIGVTDFEPTVSVTTKKTGNQILISVKDNGNGIPKPILDKIFQPFFTTKPTGQGTGLGLSLSYDIVKAHGGELKVETKENEGSKFIIQLPSNSIE